MKHIYNTITLLFSTISFFSSKHTIFNSNDIKSIVYNKVKPYEKKDLYTEKEKINLDFSFKIFGSIRVSLSRNNNFLNVSGVAAGSCYRINPVLESSAKTILQGTLANNQQIDVSTLKAGTYLLTFNNVDSVAFIKSVHLPK